jgi:phage-related holin
MPAETAIATAKITGYFGAVMVFEYLHIPQEQVTILAMLMLIDFVTGIGKQYRIDPVLIKSHTAWVGVMKKTATFVALGTIALMFIGLGLDGKVYLDSLLAILIMAEGYSVIQNVYAIRTGTILPEFDVISILLKTVSGFLQEKIEKMIKVQVEK